MKRLSKERGKPIQEIDGRKAAENPANEKAQGKLPPRAMDILISQKPLFFFIRLLLGCVVGYILRMLLI